MVRHHIKKKKGGNAASVKQQAEKEQLAAELENLDRFAGSSDEESDDGGDDGAQMDISHGDDGESSDEESSEEDADEDGDGITAESMKDETVEPNASAKRVGGKAMSRTEQSKESSDDDRSSSDDDYKDDEDAIENDLDTSKSSGMANAMTRLLGGASTIEPTSSKFKTPKANNPIVLSKTTTPLQRLQQKIKSEEQALRQKRRERRSENLTAMRLPLAPTAGMSIEKLTKLKSKKKGGTPNESDLTVNAMAIAHEIEAERTHRRIATRGVVALFNAISKHRQAAAAEAAAKEEEKARIREEGRVSGVKRKSEGGSSQTTTKHGFLDMIKSAASSSERGGGGAMNDSSAGGGKADGTKNKGEGEGKKEKSVGWSALKDDFMMNSKLKDWDKELSDDEDDDEEEENEKSAPARKRVKA